MIAELVELNQRLDSADGRISRLEIREGLVPRSSLGQAQLAHGLQSSEEALTVSVLKARLAQLEERLAKLEAQRHG